MTVVECLMFFISTVYFGTSAFFIYVCVWLINQFHDINYKLSDYLTVPVTVLLVVCCVTLLLGVFGCCANANQTKYCVLAFGVLTVFAVLTILSAALLAVAFKVESKDDVHRAIDKAINIYNNTGKGTDRSLDLLQNKLECCGAVNASDWINSPYWLHNFTEPNNRTEAHLLPQSCCLDKSEKCKLSIGNFYNQGCSALVLPKLKRFLRYGFGFCFGLAFIQVFGVIISCGWVCKRKEEINYLKINGGTYA